MVKLVITELTSKPKTNEQITVATELGTNHVRTWSKKGLRLLKQEKHANWLVALEEYPGLNSEEWSLIDHSLDKVWLGFMFSKMQSNPNGQIALRKRTWQVWELI